MQNLFHFSETMTAKNFFHQMLRCDFKKIFWWSFEVSATETEDLGNISTSHFQKINFCFGEPSSNFLAKNLFRHFCRGSVFKRLAMQHLKIKWNGSDGMARRSRSGSSTSRPGFESQRSQKSFQNEFHGQL